MNCSSYNAKSTNSNYLVPSQVQSSASPKKPATEGSLKTTTEPSKSSSATIPFKSGDLPKVLSEDAQDLLNLVNQFTADKSVLNVLETQWTNTTAEENRVTQLEFGGWITEDMNGKYSARPKKGSSSAIVLTGNTDLNTLTIDGSYIAADFHCHPGTKEEACRPSKPDLDNAKRKTYPSLVFTHMHNAKSYPKLIAGGAFRLTAPFGNNKVAMWVNWPKGIDPQSAME